MRAALSFVLALAAFVGLSACVPEPAEEASDAVATADELVPEERAAKVALGLRHATAADLYAELKARANGGAPLSLDDMPDWTGFWQRVGKPRFDPDEPADVLTSAKLKPEPRAELEQRRALSAQGIEYDPLSDCRPPGFPRWLAIPFLREFIVTPGQTYLFSETVNNLRRIYTDGREHPPAADAYPLPYGDSIGFWSGKTLVIHTAQVTAGLYHRSDPQHSEQLEAVEVWRKIDPATIVADVWIYDPAMLEEPWYVQQTYKQVSNQDGAVRIDYWFCGENPNNAVTQTSDGTSQFGEFTFTESGDR
jgi:hypothetical protein